MRRYHHIGIPTTVPQPGETYLEAHKIFCTDHERNPFGIQWMRYEPDCALPEIVKTVPHVAFEVDDLQQALEGQQILIAPNSPSRGVVVAFVLCDGAPVEFLQFDWSMGDQEGWSGTRPETAGGRQGTRGSPGSRHE